MKNNKENIYINKTKLYCKNIYKDNDIAHDYSHILRVYNTSLEIAKNYKCDLFLIKMLALLHDIDDDKLISKQKEKQNIKDFLESINVPKDIIENIIFILPFMSFRKYKKLNNNFPIEGKIVIDADRLDAIGAIGIARVFSYSSYIKRPFYSDDENIPTAIKHFDEKLLIIHNYLYTKEAKIIAKKRHKFIKDFYVEFLKEVGINNGN